MQGHCKTSWRVDFFCNETPISFVPGFSSVFLKETFLLFVVLLFTVRLSLMSAGFHVDNLRLAPKLLDKLKLPYVKVEEAEVSHLEVIFPAWTRPLSINARGLSVHIEERTMPEVDSLHLPAQQYHGQRAPGQDCILDL